MRIDKIPRADLRNAIDLKVLEWSPYAATGQYVAQVGKSALVWFWDQKKHALEADKYGAATVAVLPETVLRASGVQNGVRLLTCSPGYEGQLWENGILAASHWWREHPGKEQWFHFLLRNDAPICEIPEAITDTELLTAPWARGYVDFQVHLQANEHRIVKGVALVFCMYLVWLGSTTFKVSSGIEAVQTAIEEQEKKVEPILTNRARAIDYQTRIGHLDELTAYPSQLEILDTLVAMIPTAEIQKWVYEQGNLTLLLTGENLDPQALVQQIEAAGLFAGVTAQRGKVEGQVDLAMQLRKKRGAL